MRIAIHNGEGWKKTWITYCKQNQIDFEIVNCYDFEIIHKLKKFDILLWHFDHASPKDILMARNVLYSAEKMGLKVFPNFNTCWHFDDKVSQKYLLEAINAPFVSSWVFYNISEAHTWLKNEAVYPLVAKLRRGAGSYNVKLINSFSQAKHYCRIMFGKGVLPTPGYLADTKNKFIVAGNLSGIVNRLKKAPGFYKMVKDGRKSFPKEKGYVYFQKFVPGNTHDLRVTVIDNKAWAYRRKVRKNDFRASGSGIIDYDMKMIPEKVIKDSFNVARALGSQSIALDYVQCSNSDYKIVELSYGYVSIVVYNCPGYWNQNLELIKSHRHPEVEIITSLINKYNEN